jgi:hypothetical protein
MSTPRAEHVPEYLRTESPEGCENVEPCDYVVDHVEKYRAALRNIPASGGGGCHVALLSIANLGRAAHISRTQIASDLAAHVHGTRKVTAREIGAAIDAAFTREAPKPRKPHIVIDGPKLLAHILARGKDWTEADLIDASPVKITGDPRCGAVEVLRRLYAPDEFLFIGERYDAEPQNIVPVCEWVHRFEHEGYIPPHIAPNPLTGTAGTTKEGKQSYRADSCVKRFALATIEFDGMVRNDQIRFWAGVKLPVVALIDSAGKSIHGWVKVDAQDAAEWTWEVEGKLFSILRALGVDSSCRNEARLSRMPGHFRREKKKQQRVLYLNPTGGAIIP